MNGTAVAITGFTGIEEGYITPESRIRQGRIRFVDDNSIKIIDAEGIENTYKISSYTDITKVVTRLTRMIFLLAKRLCCSLII